MRLRHACELTLLVAATIVVACSRGDASRTDTAAAVARPLVGAAPPRHLPGTLTKALAGYSADEFMGFVDTLVGAGGTEKARKCKGAPGCGGAKTTNVFIEAIATQDSISPGTVPRFGVVYARIVNRGDAQEARYGFLPGTRYVYYLIVTGDSAKGMTWHLAQLDTTQGKRRLTETGSGVFRGCGHAWKPGARASFQTCQESAMAHDSIVHLGLMLQAGDSPIWVTCAEGCCEGTET